MLSYVEPTDEQMPLSFAHAHASDNWRISVRGTTNMGRDTYDQGQFRFHDGGVPYASDNFAWGPDGGYGIIMFADRRGFAIRPVKAEIAERVDPQQEAAGAGLGIDMQDPCPGAPAIATTMGPTAARISTVASTSTDEWEEIAPASAWRPVSPASRRAGRCSCSWTVPPGARPFRPGRSVPRRSWLRCRGRSMPPASMLEQGDVRVEEAGVEHPALVAGPNGAHLVVIVADRRALRAALDEGTMIGDLGRLAVDRARRSPGRAHPRRPRILISQPFPIRSTGWWPPPCPERRRPGRSRPAGLPGT